MHSVKNVIHWVLRLVLIGVLLAACAPAAAPTAVPTEKVVIKEVEVTKIVAGTPITQVITATAPPQSTEKRVPIIVGSWRQEDIILWQDNVIPPFEEAYKNINMLFQPTPNTYYMAGLQTALETGTGPDTFVVQAFDPKFYDKGYVIDLKGMPELDHFSDLVKSAWSTADGSVTYAMPVASVMHGFMYNKSKFDELGLTVPETVDDFMTVLEAIKTEGSSCPLAYGTADAWNPAIVAYDAVGPAYWKGEEGRWDLINGKSKMTDPRYTDPWKFLASWAPYMPQDYQSVTYSDGQQLFLQGKCLIRPVGSWEIPIFEGKTDFEIGIFTPPVVTKGDKCYVNDWIDMAFAVNAATKNPEEAKQMVQWFGSKDFAEIYTNSLPGFFTLSDYDIEVENPISKEFLSWRKKCDMTLRLEGQYLSAGTPNLTDDLWRLTQQVMNLEITPEQAGIEAQKGLDLWYKPPTQ